MAVICFMGDVTWRQPGRTREGLALVNKIFRPHPPTNNDAIEKDKNTCNIVGPLLFYRLPPLFNTGAGLPNCSRSCQTQATIRRDITILVEASGRLQTKGVPEMESTIATEPPQSSYRCSAVTRVISFLDV